MRRLVAIALVAIACGSVTAHAQALTLSYSKGATYKYTLHLTSDFSLAAGAVTSPVKSDMKAKETVTVDSVDSSGLANISVAVTDASITTTMGMANGPMTTTTTVLAMPTSHLEIARDGRILSINGVSIPGNVASGIGNGYSLVSAVLPDSAVKPGDTWSKSYDQAGSMGGAGIHVVTNSKYLRNETFHGVQAAVIQTTSTTTITVAPTKSGGTSTISLTGTQASDVISWIDPSARRLLKTLAKSSDDMSLSAAALAGGANPGLTGPFTVKGTQTIDLEPV